MIHFKVSSYCSCGNCVEVGALPDGAGVAVRDSKNPEVAALTFTAAEWADFLAGVRAGEFDLNEPLTAVVEP